MGRFSQRRAALLHINVPRFEIYVISECSSSYATRRCASLCMRHLSCFNIVSVVDLLCKCYDFTPRSDPAQQRSILRFSGRSGWWELCINRPYVADVILKAALLIFQDGNQNSADCAASCHLTCRRSCCSMGEMPHVGCD